MLQSWMLREVKEAIILRSDDGMLLDLGFVCSCCCLLLLLLLLVGHLVSSFLLFGSQHNIANEVKIKINLHLC